MKILVTGALGFIGNHLVNKLLCENHEVFCVDKKINMDIFDLTISNLTGIDVVYHLAAKVGVMDCINNPLDTMRDNYEATKYLIKLCKQAKVKKIIFTSSCEIYGNQTRSIKESCGFAPLSLYGYTKVVGEELIKQSGIEYCILRYFNIYGKGQRKDFVIPAFIDRVKCGSSIPIVGDGTDTRSFTYIDDAIEATYKALNHTGIFNIGSNNQTKILRLAFVISRILGKDLLVNHVDKRDYTILKRSCNNTKAFNEMGWKPTTTLIEGIKKMIGE